MLCSESLPWLRMDEHFKIKNNLNIASISRLKQSLWEWKCFDLKQNLQMVCTDLPCIVSIRSRSGILLGEQLHSNLPDFLEKEPKSRKFTDFWKTCWCWCSLGEEMGRKRRVAFLFSFAQTEGSTKTWSGIQISFNFCQILPCEPDWKQVTSHCRKFPWRTFGELLAVYPNFLQKYRQSCREQHIYSEGGSQGAASQARHALDVQQWSNSRQSKRNEFASSHLPQASCRKRKITS